MANPSPLKNTTGALLYVSRYCGYCMRAKQLLKSKKVDFEAVNVDGNTKLRTQLRERTGSRTVPQIWIGNTYVGGCDELYALERAGKLDPLLEQV